MVELNRTMIRNLASNDLVYNRGLRYYNNKAIRTISKSKSKEVYRATIQGKSEYTVDIDLTGKEIKYQCNCPASRKYSHACKHSVAVLLFISNHKDKTKQDSIQSNEERNVVKLLDYFEKMDYLSGIGELFHLSLEIKLPGMFKRDSDGRAAVSLHAGSHRLYKIQNVRKFLLDYRNGETIVLGKEFKYFPGESRFDSAAEPVLEFFQELLTIQEMANKGGSNILFVKSEILLDKVLLLRLLRMMKMPFQFSYGEYVFEQVTFKRANPDITFYLGLQEEDDAIQLSWEEGKMIPLDDNGNLFFYENVIYYPKKFFAKHFLPFYSLAQNRADGRLLFKGEEKTRFLNSVLPRIHETFNLTIPNSLKDNYVTDDAKFQIRLDLEQGRIVLEVIVCYGEYRFNPFGKMPEEKTIIVRQPSREADCFEQIENLGFIREGLYFYLKKEEDIYTFLTENIQEFSEKYEVYYSKEFANMKVTKPKFVKTSIRVKEDNDLLEVGFEFEGVSKEELNELFKNLKLKKKYFRLKGGSFLDLTNEKDLERIKELLDNISEKTEGMEEGKIYTSIHKAFYLNQMIEEERYNIEVDEAFSQLIEEINAPSTEKFSIPDTIHAELRPYQHVGFEWLMSLSKYKLGGILADDMGLGKTLQAITYMTKTLRKEPHSDFMVVCPSSLLYNWQDELESFSPDLRSVVVIGTPEERKMILQSYSNYDVILISYPILRRDIELLKEITFHTVFIDEAQFIKNPDSINAKAVKSLNAVHRFALTGTPIENNLSELWSIFDYLMPGYLYSHAKFVNTYEKPIVKYNDEEVLKKLNFHIKPFILRRMKRDVLHELPEKTEKKMISDMTEPQKEVYLSYLEEIKKKINMEISENGFEKSRFMILASLTRLRQICCHPATFVENYGEDSGKLNLLLQLVENAIANGHRILIFSQFTSMLKIIEGELRKLKIGYFYLDGGTPVEERSENVKAFNAGEKEIYLVSLKAGGTGLNLVGADMVIHYDPWWNPAVEEQATDRVYRIGQKNKVTVIKLITKGTIEEKIYKLQERKRDLADSVIKAGEVFINKLTREEVEDLFHY